jgi:hypothetical protein
MIHYLQLERAAAGFIDANDPVIFESVLSCKGTNITYDPATGIITFTAVGTYFFNWFVAQQTGLSTNGSNFAIVTSDSDPDIGGSSHVKISPASGFAVVEVTTPGKTVMLVNKATHRATLSSSVAVKAALSVFGVASTDQVNVGYLQAQVSAATVLLDEDESIIFDELIANDINDGVIIDPVTDDIVISTPGTYLITWEIPIDSTDVNDTVSLSLTFNDVPYSTSYRPLPIGVVSGSAVAAIEDADTVVKIVNTSGDKVNITRYSNIVISQIE